MTLDELKIGHSGQITQLEGDSPLTQRLMVLGLLEGTVVKMIRRALGGDPIEIDVMGYCLSLRKAEARHILIEHLPKSR
jgi:ferrous iron transport protein A